MITLGFPDGSDGKESACNAGDPGSIPGWGRTPGEGKGYPLQQSWVLGGIGGRRRRGRKRMKWLDGITDLMDVSLSELQEFVTK